MKVTAFLIKYGEIAIKGKNRYMFEDALMKQIRHAMAPVGDFKVRKESGRMFVEAQDEFDYDEAVEALQRVFGIVGICPMVIEENKDMEHLTETVIKFIDEQYPVKDFTFKVHARRGDKQFPLDSMAINMEIGGQLLDAFEGIKVDVHHPQVMVAVFEPPDDIEHQIDFCRCFYCNAHETAAFPNSEAFLLFYDTRKTIINSKIFRFKL